MVKRKEENRFVSIEQFQRSEILGLAELRRDKADRASLRAHYTRIGEWLPSELGECTVLELGCGPGRYVALLASLGFTVTGADPFSYPLWSEIKSRRNVTFLDGIKAEKLPFLDASFDHIACLGALLYFDDPDLSLNEIKRVLKPSGRLFMRTVNRRNLVTSATGRPIDPMAKNHYTELELKKLLERNGFKVDKTFSYGFFPPFMPQLWWYLVNGKIPIAIQEFLSILTPRRFRVNVVAFASLQK